jgi:16S rRNA (uracil1498-N3)-methyltransferase
MNIFYAPPSQINNGFVELLDQEAMHASRVMRVKEGDRLTVVDGRGGWYEGPIRRITKKSLQVEVADQKHIALSKPALMLGMGIIKKRDRLEFAVEKAVELGATEIYLFRSEHTIKENVRMDRLEAIARSAMKQSLRAWLPEITLFHSLDEMLASVSDAMLLVAHEKVDSEQSNIDLRKLNAEKLLLLVGPEGGFSSNEIEKLKQQGANLVSLGNNRLRAETAAVTFLSQFI